MTDTRAKTQAEPPTALYPRLLGSGWRDLNPAIRQLHLTAHVATGRFELHHGRSLAARFTCFALRLPSPAAVLEARLVIVRDAESEKWVRTFGPRVLVTTQRGQPDGTLSERFGALELRFHLQVVEDTLKYVQAGTGVMVGRFRIPLPRWISPRVESQETCIDGRRPHVRVRISAPWIGLVMSYEGCVQVESA